MADWLSSVTQLVGSGTSVYKTVKDGQTAHDLLSQELQLQQEKYQYDIMNGQQLTKNIKSIVVLVAVVVVIGLVILSLVRKRSG